MQIQHVSIESVKLDPDNLNDHDGESIESIAASLSEFGQQNPVIVRKDGLVLRGNGVVQAMRSLGWTGLDIAESDLEGDRAVAYGLADNRTAEKSSRDKAKVLDALKRLGQSIPLESMGYNLPELEVLNREVDELLGKLDLPGGPFRTLRIGPPPRMAWVLIGVPVEKYALVDGTVKALAATPGVICETGLSLANGKQS
jgi:ParB-like nuclease domain